MKIIKAVLVVLAIAVIFILVAMNATPGHFQDSPGCGCNSCGYHTREDFDNFNSNMCWAVGACFENPSKQLGCSILETIALLDFNR